MQGVWECKRCHKTNNLSTKECGGFRCREWRPRSSIPKRKGDWSCCGETQFASRQKCRKCFKDKTNDKEEIVVTNDKVITFRHGDWMCGKCQVHQFAHRTECFKCGASRPAKEDKDGNDIGNPCVICYENERNVAFVHGDTGHFVCCKECAVQLDVCPMCRQKIVKVINIY